MIKKNILFAILLFASVMLNAQTKTTTHYNQFWTAYFNQTRFTDKFGIWADFHLRTKDDYVEDLSNTIARLGLTY